MDSYAKKPPTKTLQTKRSGSPRAAAPTLARKAQSCACGGGCPRCTAAKQASLPSAVRVRAEAKQGVDFSNVRIHTDAANVTAPLRARAVTQGQDIYFHPGQYRPNTPAGDALIAHELAHTRQTRDAEAAGPSTVSKPGDRLERNADALAHGAPVPVMSAPAGAALRSPFDSETADARARRERLLESISTAINKLLRMLSTGGLIAVIETPYEHNGVRGVLYGGDPATVDDQFISYRDRDRRVRRIIRSLQALGTMYRAAPIAADFPPPTYEPTNNEYLTELEYTVDGAPVHSSIGGPDEDWTDLQGAYMRYQVANGRVGAEYQSDWYYLDARRGVVPGAARGAPRTSRGTGTGAYIVVPDIEHDPLRYVKVDGYTPLPRGGSPILEIWNDDFGYYYMYGERRIDVPSPWR
jgi:hypothetical protein